MNRYPTLEHTDNLKWATNMTGELAIHGGPRVRQRPWPTWPIVTPESEDLYLAALHSGRWTVSGAYTGNQSYEQQFARAFADFHGVGHCVPTCHGSSALTVALEALGIGPGAEVLVPGLTWVACASSVSGIGAVPVLVDVDRDTFCMSLEAARNAISSRTRAIMLVHLFSSSGDLDGFAALSRETGIALLEDCSQAHGAVWRGQRVGSIGRAAAFSFQQTKLLTAGEGGAVLTDDPVLADKMEQLRADGRRFVAQPRIGELDLEEIGAIQGRNYCMTEFQAALLLEGLRRLDDENALRRRNAAYLAEQLKSVGDVALQAAHAGLEQRTFYHLCLVLNLSGWHGWSVDEVAAAVAAELGLGAVEPVDTPLSHNKLYNPLLSPRTAAEIRTLLDPGQFGLPNAETARSLAFTLPHRALLGNEDDMDDIVATLRKVKAVAAARPPIQQMA